ncbi:MAG: AsmA-like C-terminal region-containing protein, partial [Burkholderiales bacterium]
FMRYIQQTPINEIIGRIPDQVRAKGNGEVNLHLKVPFAKPEHTQVSGSYNFINNEIKFDLPVPLLRRVTGKLFFTDHGVKIEKIEAKTLNSMTILSATTAKNGIMHFKINSPALDYNAASSFYLPFLAPLISGKSATNIYFNIGKQGLDQLGASSTLQGVKLDAPAPLAKEFTDISKMNLTMLNKKANFAISFDYANRLFGNLSLNQHGQIDQGLLAVGTKEFATANPNRSKLVINANLDEMHIFTWLETIKKLTATNSSSKTTTFTNSITKKPQPAILATQPLSTESATIFPLEILLNTNNLYVEQQNFHKANADLLVTQDQTLFNFNNTQANGFGSYTYANQQLDLFLNKFNLQHSIDNNLPKVTMQQQQLASVANFESSVKPTESLVVNHTQDLAVNLVKPAIESAVKVTAASFNSAPMGQLNSQRLNFPTINLLINNLYYENHSLGKFSVRLRPVGPDLLIEDGELTNEDTARIVFSGVNYCMECGSKKALVNLTASVKINDLGALLENLDYGQIIAKAKGEGSVSVQWNGQLQDFDFAHAIAEVSINLTSGKFLKVDTNNIIGRIIGLINLQTLVSFAKLEFAEIFANGFYFDQLNLKAYLLNNKIDLKNLTMSGPLANVHSLGSIDIPNDNLNLYLSVTPRLGTSLAIGAAIATAN